MLGAVFILAQLAAAPVASQDAAIVRAIRASTPIELDGRLTDPAWRDAQVITDFRQRGPDRGAPSSERTEARVLFDEQAVYVAVWAYDRSPSEIVAPLSRRDDLRGSDRVGIHIDSWFDRRTGFGFFVSPAGVKLDEYVSNDNQFDLSWDATWSAATARTSEGWTAEFRIPLSQLRFRATTPLRFGFNVIRTVARRSEVSEWQSIPQDLAQFVSRFGVLELDGEVSTPRRIEVLPYFTTREQFGSQALPVGARSFGGTAGVDLRLGLGPSLTLTAAVNPDFGQLDGDPGSINLGASELFFAERRPFFVEGSGAFQFGLAASPTGPEALIYTRRIGRTPQLANGGGAPTETTILGAAKVTGRVAGGWNVATLAALTAEEGVHTSLSDGRTVRSVAEPAALYAAGSLGRDMRGGRTVLTALGTMVTRDLSDAGRTQLRSDALVLAGDLLHRWGPGDRYQWRTTLAGSRVAGSTEAILATQRSSVRYYQRPDNESADLDSTRTSLSGVALTSRIERRAGDWRWYAAGLYRSPGFEANDLGFHFWSGRMSSEVQVTRRADRLGSLSNAQVRFSHFYHGTTDGDRINSGINVQFNGTFGNGWFAHAGGWYRFGGVDVQALRGGPAVKLPANPYATMTIESNPNRRLRATFIADWWDYVDGSQRALVLTPTVTWRPSTPIEVGVGMKLGNEVIEPQHLRTVNSGTTASYLVGRVRQRTGAITLRGNFTFSPTLSLQFWGEPFVATGSYDNFRRVVDPRAARDADRYASVNPEREGDRIRVDLDGDGTRELVLDDPDFTTASLRSNLVLRWEYRPSSTLFLVWQHGRALEAADGRFRPMATAGDLLSAPARHQVALKVSYWWNAR
jgi:hypothetical protein